MTSRPPCIHPFRALLAPAVLLAALALGPAPTRAADMVVAKDSIRPSVKLRSCTMGDDGCKGSDVVLYPSMSFAMTGPLPSGATAWVEFRVPGKKPLRMDGVLDDVFGMKDRYSVEAGGSASSATGFVYPLKVTPGAIEFTLGLRNELKETNTVLYEGSFKYDKYAVNPKEESSAEVVVNDDWRLPIGYLYMGDRGLHVVTWYRGRPGGVRTFLFQGETELAKNETCGIGGPDDFDPTMHIYWEVDCELTGVYGDAETAKNGYEPNYDLSAHPGEYSIKCLAAGKLARVIKFTVKPDGSFDNGLAEANQLGTPRVIVPVEVRLDNPVWDKLAWKTGAYYGHPLTGFTPPQ